MSSFLPIRKMKRDLFLNWTKIWIRPLYLIVQTNLTNGISHSSGNVNMLRIFFFLNQNWLINCSTTFTTVGLTNKHKLFMVSRVQAVLFLSNFQSLSSSFYFKPPHPQNIERQSIQITEYFTTDPQRCHVLSRVLYRYIHLYHQGKKNWFSC